ncbi:MAG: sigma-70 family RNA polymerase sigma factor [Chromatiales bacterium]|jgi:RNA polymerase sigma-70 factor (ECF subfamily)
MNTETISLQAIDQGESPPEAERRRFDALVRRYSRDLYRFAYWLSHDHALVEDLVQETLLRAWRGFHRLRADSAAKYWLFTILRREHARHYATRRPHDSLESVGNPAHPDRGYDTSTEAFVLRRALAALPAEYREPLVLQVLFGLNLKEIAEVVGISSAGVATRVFRARKKLREVLD